MSHANLDSIIGFSNLYCRDSGLADWLAMHRERIGN